MLSRLSISNFIIIDELEVDFNSGFNVITGETGAGKSIILGAVEVLLGKKVGKNVIKKGGKPALIQAVFEREDEEFIITREIRDSGKSIAKVNGEIVSISELKKITEGLVTIFAQDDKLKFLSSAEQLRLYDSYVFSDSLKLLELRKLSLSISDIRDKLLSISDDSEKLNREKDFIEFQMKEIDDANITQEDESLDEELDYYENIKGIMKAHDDIYSVFEGGDYSVFDMLSKVENRLSYLSGFGKEYVEKLESFNDMYYGLKDISSDLNRIVNNIYVDEEKAYNLEKRRDLINTLKLKYGNSLEEIQCYREKLEDDYQNIINAQHRRDHLATDLDNLIDTYKKLALEISTCRKEHIENFETMVTSELQDLNFKEAVFKIDMSSDETISLTGYDRLKFMVKLNSGLDFEELKKVASGGELSRIMLAIWQVISSVYDVPLLIFDEIDTGVGGMTANALAEKLYNVSKHHQIISVSHLLQMAIYADHHYYIEKQDDGKSVSVSIAELNDDEIIDEIQRLIGRRDSDGLRDEAVRMLEEVRNKKK